MSQGRRTVGAAAALASDAAIPSSTWIAPSQWFAIYSAKRRAEPGTVALALAVAEDAIRCFARRAPACGILERDALREEAERWLADTGVWIFSFPWCCELLGLDPECVRKSIRENAPAVVARLGFRNQHSVVDIQSSPLTPKTRPNFSANVAQEVGPASRARRNTPKPELSSRRRGG